MSEITEAPTVKSNPNPNSNRLAKRPRRRTAMIVLTIGIGVVVIAGSWVFVSWGLKALTAPPKQELVQSTVASVGADLPESVDAVTTWDAVTAEEGTIHYWYTLSTQVDRSTMTEEAVSGTVLPSLCSTDETRTLLDADVALRYTYAFESGETPIDLTFTRADC